MDEKERLSRLERALRAFWQDFGEDISVNAKHTYVKVEPKYILGNCINPEVAKKIMGVYLSELTSDQIVRDEILVTKDGIKIYHDSDFIMEVNNKKLVNSISNKITAKLGEELAKKQKKGGENYLAPKEKAEYTFGEIKHALAEFLLDQGKNDSKNMLKDAVMLLVE